MALDPEPTLLALNIENEALMEKLKRYEGQLILLKIECETLEELKKQTQQEVLEANKKLEGLVKQFVKLRIDGYATDL